MLYNQHSNRKTTIDLVLIIIHLAIVVVVVPSHAADGTRVCAVAQPNFPIRQLQRVLETTSARAGLLRELGNGNSTGTRRYAMMSTEIRVLASRLYHTCVKNTSTGPNKRFNILLQLADRPLGQPRPRSSLRNCFRGQTGPFPKPHQHLVLLLASSRSWLRARRTRPAPSSCTLPNFPVPCPVPTSSLRIPPTRAPHCRS